MIHYHHRNIKPPGSYIGYSPHSALSKCSGGPQGCFADAHACPSCQASQRPYWAPSTNRPTSQLGGTCWMLPNLLCTCHFLRVPIGHQHVWRTLTVCHCASAAFGHVSWALSPPAPIESLKSLKLSKQHIFLFKSRSQCHSSLILNAIEESLHTATDMVNILEFKWN